jgi:dihydrofolate reductase
VSLDGCIAGADGGVEWLDRYRDAAAEFGSFLREIGACIMGRATFDIAMARGFLGSGYGAMPTWVLTHRPLGPAPGNVRTAAGDPGEVLRRVAETVPMGDIWLMGGGKTIRPFHEARRIDRWEITLVPTVLGGGIPLFLPSRRGDAALKLLRTRTFPSGCVELCYEPVS